MWYPIQQSFTVPTLSVSHKLSSFIDLNLPTKKSHILGKDIPKSSQLIQLSATGPPSDERTNQRMVFPSAWLELSKCFSAPLLIQIRVVAPPRRPDLSMDASECQVWWFFLLEWHQKGTIMFINMKKRGDQIRKENTRVLAASILNNRDVFRI